MTTTTSAKPSTAAPAAAPHHLGFTRWLRTQRRRDDPVGDVAREVARDSEWPRRARTLAAFQCYLVIQRDACAGALRALERAWQEYTGSRGKGRQSDG